MSGQWIKNGYGGEYYRKSQEEEEEEKKVTCKKILEWLCSNSRFEPDTLKHCIFLDASRDEYSVIEKVHQLIKYRDIIHTDYIKYIYHNDEISQIVQGRAQIRYRSGYSNGKNICFSEFLDLFYKEYPEAMGVALNNKIDIYAEKLKTVEQFQAQILDKLTVFAEMLDEIQKGPIKVINYKQSDILLPVNPPDYEAVSLDVT